MPTLDSVTGTQPSAAHRVAPRTAGVAAPDDFASLVDDALRSRTGTSAAAGRSGARTASRVDAGGGHRHPSDDAGEDAADGPTEAPASSRLVDPDTPAVPGTGGADPSSLALPVLPVPPPAPAPAPVPAAVPAPVPAGVSPSASPADVPAGAALPALPVLPSLAGVGAVPGAPTGSEGQVGPAVVKGGRVGAAPDPTGPDPTAFPVLGAAGVTRVGLGVPPAGGPTAPGALPADPAVGVSRSSEPPGGPAARASDAAARAVAAPAAEPGATAAVATPAADRSRTADPGSTPLVQPDGTLPSGPVSAQATAASAAPAAASAASAMRATAAARTLGDRVSAQVFPELTRLASRVGDGVQRVTLRLEPRALGEVRVVLTLRQGAVHVRLAAGEEARAALLQSSGELHRLLELSGTRVGRIDVLDPGGAAASPVTPSADPAASPAANPDDRGAASTGPGPGDGSRPDAQHRTGQDPDSHQPPRTGTGQHATDGTDPTRRGSTRPPAGPPPGHPRAAGVDLTM